MWPFNRKKHHKTIGEITYAIDHATDLLSDGSRFKSVVMENGKMYENLFISFNTKVLEIYCTFQGSEEEYTLELLDEGLFRLRSKINGTRLGSTFNDLRTASVTIEQRHRNHEGSSFRSERVENIISDLGGNPEILRSCITAFKAYIRNRGNGKLDGTYVKPPKKAKTVEYIPTKTQGDNLKSYQLERREVVKSLRDAMVSAKEHYGVSVVKRGAPKIGVIYTYEYIDQGIREICQDQELLRYGIKLVRKYHFETVLQAQSYYPSAVEACYSAIEMLEELKTFRK